MSILGGFIIVGIDNPNVTIVSFMTSNRVIEDKIKKDCKEYNFLGGFNTYDLGEYRIHILKKWERIVMCITKEKYKLRTVHLFVNELFETAIISAKFIESRISYYNDTKNDPIDNLQKEIDDTKDIILLNIDKLITRGELLDILVVKSEELLINANDFHVASHKLKKQYGCANIKLLLLIFAIIIMIVGFIILFIFLLKKK